MNIDDLAGPSALVVSSLPALVRVCPDEKDVENALVCPPELEGFVNTLRDVVRNVSAMGSLDETADGGLSSRVVDASSWSLLAVSGLDSGEESVVIPGNKVVRFSSVRLATASGSEGFVGTVFCVGDVDLNLSWPPLFSDVFREAPVVTDFLSPLFSVAVDSPLSCVLVEDVAVAESVEFAEENPEELFGTADS
jgi:hypothetical protein